MSINLSTDLLGVKLKNPFILGSGPISYGAAGMIRAHQAGIGAVVTKTIREKEADNPYPHIAFSGNNSMVNAEKWADLPAAQYAEKEIPEAVKAGAVVIGSIGHTPEEAEQWVPRIAQAGAAMIELVSYFEDSIIDMTRVAKKATDKPVLVKLSPNWSDPLAAAQGVLEAGADGITAMDSIGPVLRINIRNAKPLLGAEKGFGWLTGSAIKPIVLRYVAEIAQMTEKPIVGIGGVMNAEDAVEMLMAGASAVGICTAPIIRGLEYIGKLTDSFSKLAEELGYASAAQISRAALSNLPSAEVMKKISFTYDKNICTACNRCVQVCPYGARTLSEDKTMNLDEELCRYCGLCVTVCNPEALTINKE